MINFTLYSLIMRNEPVVWHTLTHIDTHAYVSTLQLSRYACTHSKKGPSVLWPSRQAGKPRHNKSLIRSWVNWACPVSYKMFSAFGSLPSIYVSDPIQICYAKAVIRLCLLQSFSWSHTTFPVSYSRDGVIFSLSTPISHMRRLLLVSVCVCVCH